MIHRAKQLPGPGSFDIQKAEQMQRAKGGGGKFNMSKAKSELDWVIHRAKEGPGPGTFDIQKAEEKQRQNSGGGKFNMSKAKSEVGEMRAEQPADPWTTTTTNELRVINEHTFPLNLSQQLDWVIHRAKEGPGPGQFDVQKAEKLQRQNSGGGKFNMSNAKSEVRSIEHIA